MATDKTNEMLEIGKNAVLLAKQKGAAEVAAIARRKREVDVTWRDGKLEKIAEATSRVLEVRLFVDGRYAACSTSDLRPEALDGFLENSIALTRTLAKDPHRSLPDPALYKGLPEGDLAVADPKIESISALDLRRAAEAMEGSARGVKGKEAILSVTTNASHAATETTQVHSNGLEVFFRQTQFSLSTDTSIKDDDGRRPEEGDYAVARFFSDLPNPEVIGRRSTERAVARRGAKKIGSKVMPVVLENRTATRFLGFLLRPLHAWSLQQKRSFLEGLVGKPFGSERLDLTDDPLVLRGLGTRPFDGEGMASRAMPIFEKGVLKNHYVDTYYGKKLGIAPTTGRPSNVVFRLGSKGESALIADVKDGIFVTAIIGGNSNDTTGDFSVGVQGFAIRGGKLAEPIAEMNVSGRHTDLWKRLVAVGNDKFLHSATGAPTLVFEGVQVAGT